MENNYILKTLAKLHTIEEKQHRLRRGGATKKSLNLQSDGFLKKILGHRMSSTSF